MLEGVHRFLVIGLDVASLASSAKNVGYDVFVVDYFGDSDLVNSCLLSLSIKMQKEDASCGRLSSDFNPEDFLVLTKKLVNTLVADRCLGRFPRE